MMVLQAHKLIHMIKNRFVNQIRTSKVRLDSLKLMCDKEILVI